MRRSYFLVPTHSTSSACAPKTARETAAGLRRQEQPASRPRRSMRIGCTRRARRLRRLARRRARYPPAGIHRVRRRPRRRPTNGGSAARVRRVARGPIGAVPRWCLNTPRRSMRIGCTRRARRPHRSPRRPVGCLRAGHRRVRRPTLTSTTSGGSAGHVRRASRGPVGEMPR